MKKKIAVIISPSVRNCPFGLSVNISCKNAGDSVDRMQPLEDIEKDSQDRYRQSNRRIYREYKTGERCKYADKIIEDGNAVNCDFGDNGAGIRDTALPAASYYPMVFNGMNQDGLYSYPMNNYMDNSESRQYVSGLFATYAETGEVLIQKTADLDDNDYLVVIETDSIEFLD